VSGSCWRRGTALATRVGEKQLYRSNDLSGNFAKEQQAALEDPAARAQLPAVPTQRAIPRRVCGEQHECRWWGSGGGRDRWPCCRPAADLAHVKWDTDGYAKPRMSRRPTAHRLGWSREKWNNHAHQTPKYVVGRILSQFPPRTTSMEGAVAEIQKAFPGTTFNGKDKISIPGVGNNIDILQAAGVGGKAWRWGTNDKAGGGKSGGKGVDTSGIQNAADAARGYAEGGDIAGGSDIAKILARLGQLSGSNLGGVNSARDAVLRGLR
jgi:hypothetical protein